MPTAPQPTLFATELPRLPAKIGIADVVESNSTHLLNVAKGRIGSFDYTLNPYRGCSFGCSYCYAPFFEPDEDKRSDWGKWVEVKQRTLDSLQKADLFDKRIFMSSVTDPYQPLEAKTRFTRSIVEVLRDRGARLVVQTRSPIVERDIDLFKGFRSIRINLSIPTDSDEVRRAFEPQCASIDRRLQTVKKLKDAGLEVAVCIAPMLPMEDPSLFGEKLNELKVDRLTATFFHDAGKPFVAGTRPEALEIAKTLGWTRESFLRNKTQLERTCPALMSSAQAFGPS